MLLDNNLARSTRWLRALLVSVTSALLLVATTVANAAVDMFLKIEGDIKGESQDSKHKGEIDVLAWSWEMSQSGTFQAGRGGGAGKANFGDISITKWVDLSSPALMQYLSNGAHLKSATLTVRKAGKRALEYIKIEMKKVLVTGLSVGGSDGEDRLAETITLNFAEVKVTYTAPKPGGRAGAGEVKVFGWDIAANKSQ